MTTGLSSIAPIRSGSAVDGMQLVRTQLSGQAVPGSVVVDWINAGRRYSDIEV